MFERAAKISMDLFIEKLEKSDFIEIFLLFQRKIKRGKQTNRHRFYTPKSRRKCFFIVAFSI